MELTLHNVDRRLLIAGRPGPRDWYANLLGDPHLTIVLNRVPDVEVPASAHPVTDWSVRRQLMQSVMVKGFGYSSERTKREIDLWVTRSPLVVVEAEWPGWVNAAP